MNHHRSKVGSINMDSWVKALLGRAPHWMLDIVEWMLARDSRSIRWLKRRAAAGLSIPEPIRPNSDAPIRVFFGPFNYAGQAWHWARSIEKSDPRVSARNLTVIFPNDLGFESNDRVPATVFAGSDQWQDSQRKILADYTHVVIESFTSLLGAGRGGGVEKEIQWHLNEGRKIALLCHGTDIRSPEGHLRRNQYSPFTEMDRASRRRLERRTQQNQGIIAKFDVPVFFSTPDLVHDVPRGSWLPLVVDPAKWERAVSERGIEAGSRAVPVLLHAPTSTRIKGTDAVEKAVEALGSAVVYRPLSGIPSARMPDELATVDIVIDQLLLGSYGVAACEAMAAGRVVVGNVDEEVRAVVRESSGLELPIVQATPDTLKSVLEFLAANPKEQAAVAALGPAFIREAHSASRTGKMMADFLGLPRA
jgi:hypothetical protein